jgi:hypothetical protein
MRQRPPLSQPTSSARQSQGHGVGRHQRAHRRRHPPAERVTERKRRGELGALDRVAQRTRSGGERRCSDCPAGASAEGSRRRKVAPTGACSSTRLPPIRSASSRPMASPRPKPPPALPEPGLKRSKMSSRSSVGSEPHPRACPRGEAPRLRGPRRPHRARPTAAARRVLRRCNSRLWSGRGVGQSLGCRPTGTERANEAARRTRRLPDRRRVRLSVRVDDGAEREPEEQPEAEEERDRQLLASACGRNVEAVNGGIAAVAAETIPSSGLIRRPPVPPMNSSVPPGLALPTALRATSSASTM